MIDCTYDPSIIPPGTPIGMFHCPECGEMVIAGMEHTSSMDDPTKEGHQPLDSLNKLTEESNV